MSERAILEFARAKGFHRQTLERWLGWAPVDRDALAELALSLKMSENHLREAMDWLEEIALRDGSAIHQFLSRHEVVSIRTHPRLGRADKLKRIKEQLRRWRLPRLAATEDAIERRIRALKLPAGLRLRVAPGLEGGCLEAEVAAATQADLRRLTCKLSEAAASSPVAEIFKLLAGEPIEEEPGERRDVGGKASCSRESS